MAIRGTTTEDEPSDKGFASGGAVFAASGERLERVVGVELLVERIASTTAAMCPRLARSTERTG